MKFLRRIDFFGAHGNWKIFGKVNYSTKLSITFSILLIIIILVKFFQLLYTSFVLKSSYIEKIIFKTNSNSEIDISGLKLAFCNTADNKSIEWDSHFELSYEFYDISINSYIKTFINEKCSSLKNLNDFYPFYDSKKYDYDQCYCLRFDKIQKLDNSSGNIRVNVSVKDTIIYNKYINLVIAYIDNYFDYENYPKAISKSVEYLEFKVGGISVTINDYFINKLSYDDTSFDYEFYYYRGEHKQSYSFSDKTYTYTDDNLNNEHNHRCILNFNSNKREIFHEISTFSLDIFFASCGGIFQLFHFIFQIICNVNNNRFLDMKIINLFRKEISSINMNTELSKINTVLVKKYVNLEDFYLSKIFNTEDENIKIKSDLKKYTDKKFLKKILNKFYDDCDYKVFHNLLIEFNLLKKILINEKNSKIFEILTKCDLIKVIENDIGGLNHNNINSSFSEEFSIIMDSLLSEFTLHVLDKNKLN